MTATAIESPCRKICVVDPATRTCTGCGRTLEEIANWLSLRPDERRRIMLALPERRARARRAAAVRAAASSTPPRARAD